MRITREEQMIMYALVTALRSTCGRKSVGAVIELEGRVIATGYAGPPSGFSHCSPECMKEHESGCSRTIHAEQNAVAYAARHGIATKGSTLYCTLSPCDTCAKSIISAGIKRVIYLEPYRNDAGIQTLLKANIPCETLIVNFAHFTSLQQLYAFGVKPKGIPPPG